MKKVLKLKFKTAEDKTSMITVRYPKQDLSAETVKSGAHVMITGRGCKEYAVNHDLMALFKRVFTWSHRNFSRIDLALDDIGSKIVNFGQIHEASINGWFTSRWSKWDELNSRQTSTNDFLGQTIYFGSQKSDLYCRIYNKTLERKANSNTDDAETSIPEAWTRLELVIVKIEH